MLHNVHSRQSCHESAQSRLLLSNFRMRNEKVDIAARVLSPRVAPQDLNRQQRVNLPGQVSNGPAIGLHVCPGNRRVHVVEILQPQPLAIVQLRILAHVLNRATAGLVHGPRALFPRPEHLAKQLQDRRHLGQLLLHRQRPVAQQLVNLLHPPFLNGWQVLQLRAARHPRGQRPNHVPNATRVKRAQVVGKA